MPASPILGGTRTEYEELEEGEEVLLLPGSKDEPFPGEAAEYSSASEDEMVVGSGDLHLNPLGETILDPIEFQMMQQRFEQASVYLYAGQNNIKFDLPIDTPERLTR